jgi:hypothetical protein
VLHAVYVRRSAVADELVYARWELATQTQAEANEIVATTAADTWARPVVALDDAGYAHVVWENEPAAGAHELYFATNRPSINRAKHWELY